jgi:hypothetical protein
VKFRHLARLDIPGGGQVFAQGDFAYVGHLRPPHGTTLIDCADPRNPRVTATVEVPSNVHSHKVRVHGDVMIVNRELNRPEPTGPQDKVPVEVILNQTLDAEKAGFSGGIRLYDIADKARPREIGAYRSLGTHRFDSDPRYAYISSEEHGFLGDIVVIVDIADPEHPVEAGRWWMPGQWLAGGEVPSWGGRRSRCHHPLRRGDRLYTSYWHGGFVILGIEDIAKPRFISGLDWSPPYPCPTHTAAPVPFEIMGRKVLVCTDEEVADRLAPSPNAFMWIVDVTDEAHPVPVSAFRVENDKPFDPKCWFGAHQPQEVIDSTTVLSVWFAGGLRAVDISDIYRPTEVGRFIPEPGAGEAHVQTNDLFVDRARGLVYLIDRFRGLDILEMEG